MSLRTRLYSQPDLVQDFDLAAEERYWDGLELLTAGRALGAVYVLGYVVELTLKHAYFRVEGGRPADPAGAFFGPARRLMRVHYAAVDAEAYHSVWFWTLLLRLRRRYRGRPLSPAVDWELLRMSRRVQQHWAVDLRYRSLPVHPQEAADVYGAAEWFRTHRLALWR